VIPFRDSYAPLIGEARDQALVVHREAAAREVPKAISLAFSACWRTCGTGVLGIEDALRIFVGAVRAEIAKVDYAEAVSSDL
jgi:hypothetical protein